MLLLLILLLVNSVPLSAKCKRASREHANKEVVRCRYHQEDIYRCYSKKVKCYGNCEKRNECFFCGCPISEHTKVKNKKK